MCIHIHVYVDISIYTYIHGHIQVDLLNAWWKYQVAHTGGLQLPSGTPEAEALGSDIELPWQVSHVTLMKEPCQTYEWVMSHVGGSCYTYG